jgi:flagellar FliL protein
MARDRREEPEEQAEQPKPKKGLPIKWIGIAVAVVLVVAVGAGGGYYFLTKKESAAKTVKKPEVVTIWPMEAFVVNIANAGGDRYLKMIVQLELSEPGAVAELEQIKPRLRDAILDLLATKTIQELMDLTGKQRLREDIAGRVNNVLTQGKITRVYFTEFVLQ